MPRPTGRAVVGGLLVAASAIGTFAAWSAAGDAPGHPLVVVGADLPAGRTLDPADLAIVAAEVPAELGAAAFSSVDDAAGLVLVTPLVAGDVVLRSAVTDAAAGDLDRRQVSVALDQAAALAGTLREGEEVDVLVTLGATSGAATTEVAATGAQIAGIEAGDGADGGQLIVLLSLRDDADLLALATAALTGDLTLVRRGPG